MRVIVTLTLALLAGLAIGLAGDEPERPLAKLERQVTEVARRDVRAGRIKGPILRTSAARSAPRLTVGAA